jgi:predicted ribosome quality control (RQC) complex YloA/Tae2 family protein
MGHLRVDLTEVPVASISVAAAMVEDAGDETPVRHAQRRERLIADLDRLRERIDTRLASLRSEAKKGEEAEQFRIWGELIYGYLWMTKPGQEELVVDDVRIPLDSELSAKENAQRYFEKYRKAQSASEHLPALIETAKHQLAYLAQLRTLVGLAEDFADLESLREETEAFRAATGDRSGQSGKSKRSTKPKRPRAIVDDLGNAIYVGRTGQENDRVTFDIAGPNDTWLHARGVPGSHVIVRWHNAAGEEHEETLTRAAELAAFNSSARTSGVVEVDITRRRHVRKIKGAGPGMVTYRNERTVAVSPKADRHD